MSTAPPSRAASAVQEAALRLDEFRKLRARGTLCVEVNEKFASGAAAAFLEQHRAAGAYLADAVQLLAEIATLEEPCLAEPGRRATFPWLIESLSDSFDPNDAALYERVFAQLVAHCRTLPRAREIDQLLSAFGLASERDLLARCARLAASAAKERFDDAARRRVRKVLLLSRVTLGADVAVTSVLAQAARARFPAAGCVIIGGPKLAELFGGDKGLAFHPVPYHSDGSLLERLADWPAVVRAVRAEIRGLQPAEYLLLDPDSRLLQLGLLPALEDESRYLRFPSRSFRSCHADETGGGDHAGDSALSRLACDWAAAVLGKAEDMVSRAMDGVEAGAPCGISPRIWLDEGQRLRGAALADALRQGSSAPLVAVSFGVGGNESKRIGPRFECELVLRLLHQGCRVILDRGFGEQESECAAAIADAVRGAGWPVLEAREGAGGANLKTAASGAASDPAHNRQLGPKLVIWQGGIGAWASVIGAADQFIGYDSAGQHIAAAQGVPTIDIFAPGAPARFRARWRPAGRAPTGEPSLVAAIATPAGAAGDGPDAARVLQEVLRHHAAFAR